MKTTALATLLATITLAGCEPAFEDDRQSLLLKPEILSVVLEPPEAAPGQTVTASFLLADEKGVLPDPQLCLWLPVDLLAGGVGALDEQLDRLGLGFEDLLGPSLTFTVPDDGAYSFDADGLATQPLSLFAQIGDLPDSPANPALIAEDLMDLLEQGRIEAGLRTLIISRREVRNRNPRVTGIHQLDDEGGATPLVLVRSHDQDIQAARQQAADNPLLVEPGAEVEFEADIEDEGDLEESIRYQWISTGGDFQGYRLAQEPWVAPGYTKPGDGELDQTGQTDVDPRTDPNLHPVWLIVRDSGEEAQLGQTWAEFYVRIQQPNL